MKPFDLEAARRGEPIEYSHLIKKWVPCTFVALSKLGDALVNTDLHPDTIHAHTTVLRMAPKTVTVRYRNYLIREAVGAASVCAVSDLDGYPSPEMIETGFDFIKWIHTEWQVAEIQGDE